MAKLKEADSHKVLFLDSYKSLVKESFLRSNAPNLNPLVITNCNATGPFPFSYATIEHKKANPYPFSMWFSSGFLSIAQALGGHGTFKGEKSFENLVTMSLLETEKLECLKSLINGRDKPSEAKVRNALAIHYFQPLVHGSHYVVDRGGLPICEFCKQKVNSGDTSFGNPNVWHGKADILLQNSAIKVETEDESVEEEEDTDLDDLASGEPADLTSGEPADLASGEPAAKQRKIEDWSQALAQGIVNAFCEAKRDKSLFNKFVPSFFATEKNIRIILYNCNLDILLLSDNFEIWSTDSKGEAILNSDTLVQVWLALNFDMKIHNEVLGGTACSNFKKVVGEDIYSIYLNQTTKPLEPLKVKDSKKNEVPVNDSSFFVVTELRKQVYSELWKILEEVPR